MVELSYTMEEANNGDYGLKLSIYNYDTGNKGNNHIEVETVVFLNQKEIGDLLSYIFKGFEDQGIEI